MKKIFRNIIGFTFIILGVIGSLIPIFQGWVFVLIGYIIIDFNKKYVYEDKVLSLLKKTKFGNKLYELWMKVKNKNKKVLEHKNDKVKDIIHTLNKDINNDNTKDKTI